MVEKFTLQVSMLSDWHVGTGASGEGKIDRSIARDEEGLPFLPAKTINGVIRDACEELLNWLGHDSDYELDNWATFIFGRANHSGRIRIRSGRLDDATRSYLSSQEMSRRKRIARHFSTIKAGVSIDPLSGRAKDDHLSFTEVARPMLLTAEVEILEANENVVALVAAACQMVEYVGGKRRRGLGRCEMKLLTPNGTEVLSGDSGRSLLETLNSLPEFSLARNDSTDGECVIPESSESATVSLMITALSPLLFPRHKNGNVVTSNDFIPGTALLPLIHEVVQSAGFDAQYLIRNGQIQVGNGFPIFDGHITSPSPFALSTPKGSSNEYVNNTHHIETGVVTKQLRHGWVSHNLDNSISFRRVSLVARTHNSVADELQRPTSDTGGLFTYLAIAPGHQFRSRITLPSKVMDVLFSDMNNTFSLPDRGAIGSSRKDDYGDVSLYWERQPRSSDTNMSTSDVIRMWCLSDVILKKLPGEGLVNAVKRHIVEEVNLPEEKISVEVTTTRIRPARIDSWQARWGLPRTSLFGIAAGSCITLQVADSTVADVIQQRLSTSGLGLRQSEGFGSMALNHPLLEMVGGAVKETVALSDITGSAEMPNSEVLHRAVTASIREAIRNRAVEIAWQGRLDDLPKWWSPSRGGITDGQNHQYAILRRYVMQSDIQLSIEEKEQFMHDLDAWDKASRDAAWELLSNPEAVWSEIGEFEHPLGSGAGEIPLVLRSSLWTEAVRLLVENIHRRRTRSVR